jgi:type IV secretion system protein VirD4
VSRRDDRGGGEIAVLVAAVVLATPVAIVCATTAIAGLLTDGHPIGLGLGDALGVLVRLPGTLAHPALAWPKRIRNDLPGGFALQLELALTTLLVLGVLALLLSVVARHLRRRDVGRAARWASRTELAELHVRGAQAGRITLGEHHGKLIAAEPRASVLGVGPAQSGKSTGLIVPAILEWDGPALSTSIKADVVHDTHSARAKTGQVFIFDPTGSTGLPHTSWSPIAAAHTWEGARRTAANLLGIADHTAIRNADESFWKPAGARFLAPLLLAAAHGHGHGHHTMADVLRWIATLEEDEPSELLQACSTLGAQAGLEALRSVWAADPRFRSNLTQTIATGLDAWQEPAIAAATAGEGQISAQGLLDGTNTLYLVAPAHDQRRLRGLFTALLADITAGAFERSAQTGRPINPPLLLALDEAANIAPLPNLDEIASTGPGQGVQLLTILQNISQASDRWGKDRAETIIANHRARLFCSGIGDRATLDYLRQTLGEEEIGRVATHRQNPLATGSRTYSSEFRALSAPHRVRQAHTNTALLIYGRLQPAWINLRPWYQTPHLRQLVTAGVDGATSPGRSGSVARRVLAAAANAVRGRASRP